MSPLFLVHLASAWYMTGIIWHAQIVSYPLFHLVDSGTFYHFQAENILRTAVVVIPPMFAELGSGILLMRRARPGRDRRLFAAAFAVLVVIWLSTLLDVAPTHALLAGEGYSAMLHERVLAHNWVRTLGWTLRGALLLRLAARKPCFPEKRPS